MDNKCGIFENVFFLNEAAVPYIAIGLLAGVAGVANLVEKKKRDKETAKEEKKRIKQAEEQAEQHRKALKNRIETNKEAYKKCYGIEIDETDKEYSNSRELFNDMLKDAKVWLSKIINSKIFKENIDELLNNEKRVNDIINYYNPKPKLDIDWFKYCLFIKEGITGYKESIEFCDEDQNVQIELDWVGKDIANMLTIKYHQYIGEAETDHDKGHIFYNIDID